MDGYSQPTADSMDDCLKDQAQPGLDERRGVHLLSPGDLVRYRGDLWNVTGVHLSTDRRFSNVTLTADGDRFETQLTIPLALIEGSCEVYLRATNPSIRILLGMARAYRVSIVDLCNPQSQ